MLLLIIATALQFTDFVLVLFWSLEAIALFWVGGYVQRSFVWKTALALFGLAALTLGTIEHSLWYESVAWYTPLLTERTGAFWTLAGSLMLCSLLFRTGDTLSEQKRHHALQVAGLVVLFVWTTVEVNDYFRLLIQSATGGALGTLKNIRQLAVSGVWLMDAVLIMALGMWQRIQVVRITAIVFLRLCDSEDVTIRFIISGYPVPDCVLYWSRGDFDAGVVWVSSVGAGKGWEDGRGRENRDLRQISDWGILDLLNMGAGMNQGTGDGKAMQGIKDLSADF